MGWTSPQSPRRTLVASPPDVFALSIRPHRLNVGRIGAWPRVTASGVTFAAAFAAYLAIAAAFVLGAETIVGDAFSRVGNAYYVLFSRDPHLAAIGFVWNPLPAMATLPILPLSAIWPPLVDHGFAGNIVSAAFMAAAVRQVWCWCRDLRLGFVATALVTVLFAAHPLIILYGANGMSEAPFVFFLIVAVRQIARWAETQGARELVWAGTALAFAYLTRYEAVAAAGAALAFVMAIRFIRASGTSRQRVPIAIADAVVMGLPFAAAFAVWSLASWVIVGSPFETFTSVYGGSNQIALSIESIRRATGETLAAALGYAARQIIGLHPLLLPLVGAAAAAAIIRRDARVLAVGAIFGSVILFSLVLFLAGKSFGWLRFYIGIVPLGAMAAAYLISLAGRPIVQAETKRLLDVRRSGAGIIRAAGAGLHLVDGRVHATIGSVDRAYAAALRLVGRVGIAGDASARWPGSRLEGPGTTGRRALPVDALTKAWRSGSTKATLAAAAQRSTASARRGPGVTRDRIDAAARHSMSTWRAHASAAWNATVAATRRALQAVSDRGSTGTLRVRVAATTRTVATIARQVSRDVAGRRPSPTAIAAGTTLVRRATSATAQATLVVLTLALVAISLPSGLATVQALDLAREEAPALRGLGASAAAEMPSERHQYRVARDVAAYLDQLDLPDGAVVIDVALGFWVVLQSDRPRQFVITPDRDFEAVVADPATFGARYLLVSPSSGIGSLSAITREYPGIYENGAGLATLEREFLSPGGEQHTWRLYRVDD
jgi:hypothetical protein